MKKNLNISIVIPIYNEEESIAKLYDKISKSMKKFDNYEIIFVDDGSNDNTAKELNKIECRKIYHKKNLGKSNAIKTGIKKAKYNIIVTMDGDMQNNPQDIPKFVNEFKKGYDFVCGIREKRNDNFLKIVTSRIGYWGRKIILGDNYFDSGCGFKLFKKKCFDSIIFFEGNHRFFPYLFSLKGFVGSEILIRHDKRKYGKSKYGVFNRLKTIVDTYRVRKYKK